MKKHSTLLALGCAAALTLSACGGEDESSEGGEAGTVSATRAIGEIKSVRAGLEAAYSAYDHGRYKQAGQLVGDAYLDHFELVEGPLGEIDDNLNEELEDGIREQLRDAVEGGRGEAEQVKQLRERIDAQLSEARKALAAAK